ncbi:MAG: KH domain-containing protein [Candidatus Omnitrophota bacterium]|nr:MAG: KH domain-containing protein [Candidatus Omnitrophota bacterium]
MQGLLTYITKSLVKNPDDVIVAEKITEDGILEYTLSVNPDDMGRIIGRNGKTARSVRLLVSAKASLENKRTHIEIAED